MENNETTLQKQVKYVERENVPYCEIEDQFTAMDTMKEFDGLVQKLGFQVLSERSHKWDPKKYIRIEEDTGRYVTLDSYFNGNKETIRREHFVAYDIRGLEQDVNYAVSEIGTKK